MLAETVIYRDHDGVDRAAIVTREYPNDTADLTVFRQLGQLYFGGVPRERLHGGEHQNHSYRKRPCLRGDCGCPAARSVVEGLLHVVAGTLNEYAEENAVRAAREWLDA